jgi:hypothetical protein
MFVTARAAARMAKGPEQGYITEDIWNAAGDQHPSACDESMDARSS